MFVQHELVTRWRKVFGVVVYFISGNSTSEHIEVFFVILDPSVSETICPTIWNVLGL